MATSRTEGFRRDQESVVQEARVIANLNSRNIVGVHDVLHENGTVYIVMEYLEGPTLEQEIERLDNSASSPNQFRFNRPGAGAA